MNENENTTPGAAPVPPAAPAGAANDSSRSAVFSAIRSIFGHGAPDADSGSPAVPHQPAEPPARVLVRNCSTRRVLAMLLQQFGGDASVSGRYFAPEERDVAKIRAWASSNGLFVKESRVLDTLVLDLMMDRTKMDHAPRTYGRPRYGGRFGDDDGPDGF